jgi:hypothetical protein
VKNRFTIPLDISGIADAFCVTLADAREYLSDGRRASFIIERRLVWMHPDWKLAPSESESYDLRAPNGRLWEVRCVTRNGVYFNPAGQVGKDRHFEEGGFLGKLDLVAGFILADVAILEEATGKAEVPVFRFGSRLVRQWYLDGKLGKRAQVSRKAFYDRLEPDIPA